MLSTLSNVLEWALHRSSTLQTKSYAKCPESITAAACNSSAICEQTVCAEHSTLLSAMLSTKRVNMQNLQYRLILFEEQKK